MDIFATRKWICCLHRRWACDTNITWFLQAFESEEGERSELKEDFELEFKKPPNVAFKNIQQNENDQEYKKLKVDFIHI